MFCRSPLLRRLSVAVRAVDVVLLRRGCVSVISFSVVALARPCSVLVAAWQRLRLEAEAGGFAGELLF